MLKEVAFPQCFLSRKQVKVELRKTYTERILDIFSCIGKVVQNDYYTKKKQPNNK